VSALWLANLAAYSIQLAVLVATAILVVRTISIRDPTAQLKLWQGVLIAAMVLPLLPLWTASGPGDAAMSFRLVAGAGDTRDVIARFGHWYDAATLALATGILVRTAWLGVGWCWIRRYVSRARPLPAGLAMESMPRGLDISAEVRVSLDLSGPATFGFRRPVILVPPRFLDLPIAARRAVLCHELLHIRRGDWLRTVLEEAWCAVLWFHPAARALVSRLDLAREMLVDQLTIVAIGDRRAYAQALLAFGSSSVSSFSAITPFIRPTHLSHRIAGITEEVPMSRRSAIVGLITASLLVSATTASAVRLFPIAGASGQSIAAQDQEVLMPGDGVTLPKVIHEVKPQYTPAAMQAKIQGTVWLAAVVKADGTVGRIEVTRSLDTEHGLDAAAVDAAAQWRFSPGRKDGKPVSVQVTIEMTFTLKK
jgi:TonB family protein